MIRSILHKLVLILLFILLRQTISEQETLCVIVRTSDEDWKSPSCMYLIYDLESIANECSNHPCLFVKPNATQQMVRNTFLLLLRDLVRYDWQSGI